MMELSAATGTFEYPIPAQARLAVQQFLLHILPSSVQKTGPCYEEKQVRLAILSIEMSSGMLKYFYGVGTRSDRPAPLRARSNRS
jgi:hypothetical protein